MGEEGLQTEGKNSLIREVVQKIDIIANVALYAAEDKSKYKDNLKTTILANKAVPTKYLYFTDQGSQLWLSVCKTPEYTFYINSVNHLHSKITKIVSVAQEAVRMHELDFISLGTGDGVKDHIILKELIRKLNGSGEKVFYYPIDISDSMIVEAIRNTMGGDLDRSKVDIKAIIADIVVLQPLCGIYEERPTCNFFSILGNTIGNTDEKEMISSIRDAMFPGDLVLIEINVEHPRLGEIGDLCTNEVYMAHHFVPLATLGVEFDKSQMSYQNVEHESVVPKTVTTLAFYKQAHIDGRSMKNIKLSIVHHYELEEFVNEIERRMHVKTLLKSKQKGVGIVLAQRSK